MAVSTVSDSFFCGDFSFLVILVSVVWLKRSSTGKRKKKKKKEKKNKGGVSFGSMYCKFLDFPWSFPALLGQELPLPLSFQLVLGRGLLC